MDIKQVLEAVDYRIGYGSSYMWDCYGNRASILNFNDIDGNDIGAVIYDAHTQEIFEVVVECIYNDPVCYRWTASEELTRLRRKEARDREIDDTIAWDEVKYTDIEVEEDFLQKLIAIANRQNFDRRVIIPLHLTEEEELTLYRGAHAADMTLNDYVAMLLQNVQNVIDSRKSESKVES